LLGQYDRIGIFQAIRNLVQIRFRISIDLHLVGAELWKASQGFKGILVIINDGNLHSTFALVKSISVVVIFILSLLQFLLLFTRPVRQSHWRLSTSGAIAIIPDAKAQGSIRLCALQMGHSSAFLGS
jgi:hypothetical protein